MDFGIVFKAIGTYKDKPIWMQYAIVEDYKLTIVELEPAAWFGWNIKRVTEQGQDEWPGMTAQEIKRYLVQFWTSFAPASDADIEAIKTAITNYNARIQEKSA